MLSRGVVLDVSESLWSADQQCLLFLMCLRGASWRFVNSADESRL